jgi:hypothetical protein
VECRRTLKSSSPDRRILKWGGVRSATFSPEVIILTEVYQWDLRSSYFRSWNVAKGGTEHGVN